MAVVRPSLLLHRPFSPLFHSRLTARVRSTSTRLKQPTTSARAKSTSTRLREAEAAGVERLKRRIRSAVELDLDLLRKYGDPFSSPHVPVLLCKAHEEMEMYVGMDVDLTTHNMARSRNESLIEEKGSTTMREIPILCS